VRFHFQSRFQVTIWAGVIAGTVATLIQMLLWLIFNDDFPAILFRDSRLTAALVLGDSVLPPPATFDIAVMLTATFIHFMLSIIYAAVLGVLTARLKFIAALSVSIGFGIALYVVNLYGFTMIFPWFEQARGWIALIAHGTFGVAAILSFRWLGSCTCAKHYIMTVL
jgi:hypothetical protein